MRVKRKNSIIYLFCAACLVASCTKINDALDTKVNKGDVIPKTLDDLQSLLDNDGVMNVNYMAIPNLGCDNFYLLSADWASARVLERNSYVWKPDLSEGGEIGDWNSAYSIVEYSNVVLDKQKALKRSFDNSAAFDNVRGSAFFFKAFAYFNLVQVFCKPYSSSSNVDPGIPLKYSSDVNESIKRGTVDKVYDEIVDLLREASHILPEKPIFPTRPSKPAAYALLAKAFLHQKQWDSSYKYIKLALKSNSFLYDYNTLSTTVTFPYPTIRNGNKEVVFYAAMGAYSRLSPVGRALVDTSLYASYAPNDLRKVLFYRTVSAPLKRYNFKGTLTGGGYNFGGLGTPEIYLLAAETAARIGRLDEAAELLNTLLRTRWKSNTYVDSHFISIDNALDIILQERRKECPITGIVRWEDLRRLNSDPRYAKTLIRNINGEIYQLPANDKRYVYPIPAREITENNLEQNER